MFLFEVLWIPNWLLLCLCLIALIYLHYKWNFSFWKSQGIPGPTPWPIIGHLNGTLSSTPVHYGDLDNFKKYGKIYGRYEFGLKILHVNDPDLLKSMFVKDFEMFKNRRNFGTTDELFTKTLMLSEDDTWKNMRRLMSPIFSSGKIKQMSKLIVQCCDELSELILEESKVKQAQDCKSLFHSFTVNVVAKCFFGVEVDGGNLNGPFHTNINKLLKAEFSFKLLLFLFFPKIANYFKISCFDQSALDYYAKLISQVLEKRKGTKSDRVDFLQMAMDGMNSSEETTPDENKEENSKTHLTHKETILSSIIFIFAGVGTSSTALTLLAYNLALHPDCQKRLQEEVDKVVDEHGGVDYDSVQDMPYLSAVIDETLRMYPPGTRGERICTQNFRTDTIFIPKGTSVNYSSYTMHRNPEYWPNPDVFDPERFLGDNADDHHPYAYFPFLLGPRNCIAKRFALIEVRLCVAHIMRNFSFEKCPETEIPLEFEPGNDVINPKSVHLKLVERRK